MSTSSHGRSNSRLPVDNDPGKDRRRSPPTTSFGRAPAVTHFFPNSPARRNVPRAPSEGPDMPHSLRTAIVTGASRGIGRATALRLAADFDMVVLAARSEEGLAECAAEIERSGGRALAVAGDLRRPETPVDLVSATIAATGRIDAIVNVAGAVPQSPLLALTDNEWEDGLAMKFHGARRLALAGWPHLREAQGALIFISGATAMMPNAALAAVSTINAAIAALAKAFADQGRTDNVRVNSVLPRGGDDQPQDGNDRALCGGAKSHGG